MASIGIGIVKMSAKLLVLVLLRRFPKVLVFVLGRNFGIGHLCCVGVSPAKLSAHWGSQFTSDRPFSFTSRWRRATLLLYFSTIGLIAKCLLHCAASNISE